VPDFYTFIMLFDTVCIVGVGLIGGSLGIAMRERGLARQVVGLVRREETINAAFQRGAVDNATTNLEEAARGADMVFLASPVGQIQPLCEQLGPVVRAGALVTDAGSTKADIVEGCSKIFGQKANFIGGHPMAGSERTGVEHASASLFEGAVWILTPTPQTPDLATRKMVKLIEGLGARPLVMDAAAHDALVAVTSHLPHITAAALVHLFTACQETHEQAPQLVAGGWRDSTRIAAGSPEMWRDISLANAPAITQQLDQLIMQLQLLRDMLTRQDAEQIFGWFEAASIARRKQGYFPRSTQ